MTLEHVRGLNQERRMVQTRDYLVYVQNEFLYNFGSHVLSMQSKVT
jgi:hypothetical protein